MFKRRQRAVAAPSNLQLIASSRAFACLSASVGVLQTQLPCKPPSCEVQVGQAKCHEAARGVLLKTSIPHLREAPQALHHRKHVLHSGALFGLDAVACPFLLVHFATPAYSLFGEGSGVRVMLAVQLLLRGVGSVAIDPPLVAMQQVCDEMLVVYVRGRHRRALRKASATVHAN